MTNQHPITPPPKLVQEWFLSTKGMPVDQWVTDVATQAARWGADTELEACCEHLGAMFCTATIDDLRTARRPKPPTLKEQALLLIETVEISQDACSSWDFSVVRRALESLPD